MECKGCTYCCQWGTEAVELKAAPDLPVTEEGDCGYVQPGVGCTVYNTNIRPERCRTWDCRQLYHSVKNRPVFRIIFKGKEMVDKYGER